MPIINKTNLTQLLGKHTMIRLQVLQDTNKNQYNLLCRKHGIHQESVAWSGNEQKIKDIKGLKATLRDMY